MRTVRSTAAIAVSAAPAQHTLTFSAVYSPAGPLPTIQTCNGICCAAEESKRCAVRKSTMRSTRSDSDSRDTAMLEFQEQNRIHFFLACACTQVSD
jgi:hypothetical protein